MSLSVIIIPRDAGATLRRGLEPVKWADEIVVQAPLGLAALPGFHAAWWREAGRIGDDLHYHLLLGLVPAIALGELFNAPLLDHTEGLLFAWLAWLALAARHACARPVA